MKNKILFGLAVALGCASAHAQMDFFAAPITIQVAASTVTATTTNSWVDIHGMEGVAKLDIFAAPDNAAGVETFTIQTSSDQTNSIITLANVAIAVSNNAITTNLYYGTGTPLATNVVERVGTLTTPVASTSGFATPYKLPPPFTNTATFAFTNSGLTTIGFVPQDAGRYIRVIMAKSGTGTNFGYGVSLTGRFSQ